MIWGVDGARLKLEASKGSKNMEVSQSSWGYPMTTGWFMKLPQTCSTLALDVFAEPSIC